MTLTLQDPQRRNRLCFKCQQRYRQDNTTTCRQCRTGVTPTQSRRRKPLVVPPSPATQPPLEMLRAKYGVRFEPGAIVASLLGGILRDVSRAREGRA